MFSAVARWTRKEPVSAPAHAPLLLILTAMASVTGYHPPLRFKPVKSTRLLTHPLSTGEPVPTAWSTIHIPASAIYTWTLMAMGYATSHKSLAPRPQMQRNPLCQDQTLPASLRHNPHHPQWPS